MRLSPYSIKSSPIFDPCKKCLVQISCSEICEDKLLYNRDNPKATDIKVKLRRRINVHKKR